MLAFSKIGCAELSSVAAKNEKKCYVKDRERKERAKDELSQMPEGLVPPFPNGLALSSFVILLPLVSVPVQGWLVDS